MADTTGGFEVDGPAWKKLFGVSRAPALENSRLRQGKGLFFPQLFLSAALKMCDYTVDGCYSC